jgi:hypothetical protein
VAKKIMDQGLANYILHPGVDRLAHGDGGESLVKGGGVEYNRPGSSDTH